MVATRRGVRVSYTATTNPEQPADGQATPSTSQRTRRTAKREDSPTQHVLGETCCQLEKSEGGPLEVPPSSTRKRCTRASRLHSPEQPSTPVGSIREGDASDVESCCSAVSDHEQVLTRSQRRRRAQPRAVNREDEEISEVESCSSAVSASKRGQSSRRSTRRKIVQVETEDVRPDLVLETEPCSSVMSESQRVTRSQKKSARTRSAAKQLTEDSELSDADSCVSSVSGTNAPTSTSLRPTRSRRQTCPSPVPMDKMSEGSQSPVLTGRRTRAARGKAAAAAAAADISEPPSCDSEGFESGPTYSVATWKMGKSAAPKELDSGSDVAEVHSPVSSPCSTRSRGTPCSSRTGSGSSSRRGPATRRSFKDLSSVEEPAVEDSLLNDSKLENTVIAEDADCTLLEEDKSQTLLEEEGLNLTSSQTDRQEDGKEDSTIPEDSVSGAAVTEPAVISQDQQVEPSAENNAEDSSQMEMMQETVPPSEPVTISERAPEATAEDGDKQDVADVDIQEEKPVDETVAVETGPCVEEKMEVSMLDADTPQVADCSEVQSESIQVTSRPEHMIRLESDPEQQPKDIVVQNRKVISLLDSSDDEDEYNELEEKEGSEEEDLEYREERGEPSTKSEAASSSVEGLFMIDTRPGQDADDLYYRDRGEEAATTQGAEQQEEEEEEFVDEEADDDDEDDDAHILFSSRDRHLKELSSRIDPGIRMKELGGLYISFDGSKSKPVSSSLQKLKEKKIQDEVMKKSVIGPDFEKKDSVPPYSESKQALKLKHRTEREKTTGNAWFNMKAPEMTQELKGDLQVLKMRSSLDSKRFYKKNDRDGFPKYFQVGTVVDTAADFYHSRVPKKERKRTMVEELLADAEFRHNNKKRYQTLMMDKAAQGGGKRNKKKNKFHKK